MSKISNYPRKSFKTAIDIAESVDKLGGKCSYELLAQSLGLKVSGSFQDGVNAAIKHGLIAKKKDNLELMPLYTDIKLSYTPEEKNELLKKSFLMANVYEDMLKRFDGKAIPIHILDKMLMKEFGVSESIAKSVGANLIKGAKSVGLIVNDKVILGNIVIERNVESETDKENVVEVPNSSNEHKLTSKRESHQSEVHKSTHDEKPQAKINIDGLGKNVNLNINISLSVPETTNEEVYNKFFEAMKKHLLS
jgi:hypothetical protein